MKRNFYINIAKDVLRVRFSQLIINEKIRKGDFNIPIHLALGHEAIAVAIAKAMDEEDLLVLSHRNVHYNLARLGSLKPLLDEYLLQKEGIAGGRLGSMNLANEGKGLVYTSSILGNNLSVAAGLGLAQKVKDINSIVCVITGDGAVEEGSFYETMVFLKSNSINSIIVIENNKWSLATRINERRCGIDIEKFAQSFDIKYAYLKGNDVYNYLGVIQELRDYAIKNRAPICIEVDLSTLGDYRLKTDEYPNGKYINYHAGLAPEISLKDWPIINKTEEDPVFVLKKYFDESILREIAKEAIKDLKKDID